MLLLAGCYFYTQGCANMFDIGELFKEYGAIGFGLLIGLLAHVGRLIGEGTMPGFWQVAGYILQLGLIGLISVVATKLMGITDGDIRALVTALLAISAQEVTQATKRMGWRMLAKSILTGMGLKVTDDDLK